MTVLPRLERVGNFLRVLRRMPQLAKRFAELETELDMLRSQIEVGRDAFSTFQLARRTPEYQAVFDEPEPLVTVCVATYNRPELLTERCIPSILGQTYRNIELIVVGDCSANDTVERIARINDSRLKFINLPERGHYPEDPYRRWMVAGTSPINHALSLAKGSFISHLDDDDAYLPERIERLVRFTQEQRVDMVIHPYFGELEDGRWVLIKARDFQRGEVTTSTMFYHRWFASLGWDPQAHLLLEPGDWNRLRKFKYVGASHAFYPEPLLRHYRERNQRTA
jgi:glycosyltransferase involved in cell wall biosynthesis